MTTRQKLEIPINQPITVELLFDEPISGTSRYGEYHMYGIIVNGEEYSFFPPAEVHEKLKGLHKGDRCVITKLAAQRGSKLVTVYEVRPETKAVPQQSNAVNAVETHDVEATDEITEEKEEEAESISPGDNYYEVILNCYKDALKLQKELNGMIDIEKAAITLYISRTRK
ncbi:MAG: hypothetical protein ACYCVH_11140 [Ignavibacteriaceae bacterium]